MVTIDSEYGTFTGQTVAEARRAENKAKRDAKTAAKKAEKSRAIAHERAERAAYKLLDAYVAQRTVFWEFGDIGSRYSAARWECLADGFGYRDLVIDTPDGAGRYRVYDSLLFGAVTDGAGYCLAIAGKENNRVYMLAVGVCDGHIGSVRLPDAVTPTAFNGMREIS